MSALHRLKAYFGMVPAEEFDAAEFGAYHPGHRSGYPSLGDDSQGYDDPQCGSSHDRVAVGVPTANSFATRAGYHAVPRMHPTRSPSWATEPSTTAQAPVLGSLAIDTATSNTRSTARQPAPADVQRVTPVPRVGLLAEDPLSEDGAHPLARIVTLHPHSYNEARPIGERYREGNPVIMNLTGMEDRDAKRLVDFAAGLAFALRGSIDKVTNKVFLLSPPNLDVSAEDRRRIAEGHFFN
ncbi:MAG: cell division protein SepF [Pseudonocardiaceae bacterium]